MDTNELTENITKQWLLDFIVKYEKDNHTHLNYRIFEGVHYGAVSLMLYLSRMIVGGHILVKIDTDRESTVDWAAGSTITTVDDAIDTHDLLNVAIKVAQAWAAHCEEVEEAL